MKRRSFLGLAALSPAGFPWIAAASPGQRLKVAGCVDPVREALERPATIKVIGLGGAGNNIVQHMIFGQMPGIEFICANTDADSLRLASAKTKILFGRGLATGGNPEFGRDLAMGARTRFIEVLQGADMVFIVASMGGGTGTGAAPVVSAVARELGIPTVAIVSTPFAFEGRRRKNVAWNGLSELNRHADAVIVISCESMVEALPKEIGMFDALCCIDHQMANAAEGIIRSINAPGPFKIDIGDFGLMMNGIGMYASGSGVASGPDRASRAAQEALWSPSMGLMLPLQHRRVLFSITGGRTVGFKEVISVSRTIHRLIADDATVMGGAVREDFMGDRLSVSVIAEMVTVELS